MNRVLLVDDEYFARQGLKNLMDWQRFGYEVCAEADNGEEALQHIETLKPDVVITDIRMPVLDGLALIRSVRESGNVHTKFIIISGYSDFTYAQQAIKYDVENFILKPIDEEELLSTLNKLAPYFEKARLQQIEQFQWESADTLGRLLGGQLTEQQMGAFIDVKQFNPQMEYLYFIIEVNGIKALKEERLNAEQWKAVKAVVYETACTLFGEGRTLLMHEKDCGLYGFLLSLPYEEGEQTKLAQSAKQVCGLLKQKLGYSTIFYAGEPFSGLMHIQDALNTADEVRKYKYAFAEQCVFFYERMKTVELNYMEAGQVSRLLELMEEKKKKELRETVDRIFTEFQVKRFAPEAVKNSIDSCVFGVIRAIKNLQGDEKELASLQEVLQWQRYPMTLWELRELFRGFAEDSAQLIDALRKIYVQGDIVKVKAYIESHFDQKISLKSIAAKFYMNPVYLGQLFKKKYGEYFNDFLLNLRIHKAKELLRQTDMRVYEIADDVGFSNADYFVSQFEKVERSTPTEYRNMLISQ